VSESAHMIWALRKGAVAAVLAAALSAAPAASGPRALIVHKRGNSLGCYDAATGAKMWVAPVGQAPHEMALSEGDRFAFVTNYGVDSYRDTAEGGHTISVVDVVAGRTVAAIDLGAFRRPHGIVRGFSGRLYVTVDHPAAVLEVDGDAHRVARAHALDQALPHMVAVTPDEQTLIVANAGSGTVTVLDRRTQGAISVKVGGTPMGLALSRGGRQAFVATREGNAVAVIDVARRALVRSMPLEGQPARVRLTPDDRVLLVTLIGAGALVALDPERATVLGRVAIGPAAEGLGIDYRNGFGYASAQGANRVVKFSLTDWRPVLEIATDERPDPIEVIEGPGLPR
jgi:YVTN family beta-propeller protein